MARTPSKLATGAIVAFAIGLGLRAPDSPADRATRVPDTHV